jgi:hypothetical protein
VPSRKWGGQPDAGCGGRPDDGYWHILAGMVLGARMRVGLGVCMRGDTGCWTRREAGYWMLNVKHGPFSG